jgi:pimeloyl-ACP methyl ester carboxylesterase
MKEDDLFSSQTANSQWIDKSPHKVRFVNVNGIRLHYLDWGGKGEAVLFLTGFGDSAHIFDDLAPQFANQFRVLGLTRRGHGQSDKPETGYDTATRVDDIRQFLELIEINRATLVGHSLAGDEMTQFAGSYPDRLHKLIYLDAAYDHSELTDSDIFAQAPKVFQVLGPTDEDRQSLDAYRNWYRTKRYRFWSDAQEADMREVTVISSDGRVIGNVMPEQVAEAIKKGARSSQPDYSRVKAPALAFYSLKTMESWFPWITSDIESELQREAQDLLNNILIPYTGKNIARFRMHTVFGKVVELENTDHLCFIPRREEITHYMREFLSA